MNVQQIKPYYYWDNNFVTDNQETLQQCYEKYGIGRQKIPNSPCMMDVIFLDDTRSFGNSWCLKAYHKNKGTNIPVRLCENDKVYGQCPYI